MFCLSVLTLFLLSCGDAEPSFFERQAAARAAEEAQKTPEQRAAEAAETALIKHIVRGAKSLKQMSKNPDSFKLEGAILMSSGAVCYSYRAANSFNAILPGNAVLVEEKLLLSDSGWNKYCAGKTPKKDYSSVRIFFD